METASDNSSSSTPKELPSIDFDSLSPVEQKKWVLDTFGKEFCDGDREATKAYVRENWKIMKYATEELRNDEDILMHAGKIHTSYIMHHSSYIIHYCFLLFPPSKRLTYFIFSLGNSNTKW